MVDSRLPYVLLLIWINNITQELRTIALSDMVEMLSSSGSLRDFCHSLMEDPTLVEKATVAYLRDLGDERIVNQYLEVVVSFAFLLHPGSDTEPMSGGPVDTNLLAKCLIAARRQLCAGDSMHKRHNYLMLLILSFIK